MTFLDDATRFGLTAVVGTSEKKELFLRGLWRALSKWGRFSAMFLDNGGAFKADDVAIICARLDIALIHGTAGYPEGHGKIERFNGTIKQDLLRTFDGNPEIDPLESALVHSIEETLRSGYVEQGRRQVIIFDEAHDMRESWLRMLRLITNYDMDSKLVVSIILCGQTPLKERLMSSQMEDIRQRLVHFGELRLLTRDETRNYIEHRSRIAGIPKPPFDTAAIEALFELSRGNMRAIDQLCSKALELSSKSERDMVDEADIAAARNLLWI